VGRTRALRFEVGEEVIGGLLNPLQKEKGGGLKDNLEISVSRDKTKKKDLQKTPSEGAS